MRADPYAGAAASRGDRARPRIGAVPPQGRESESKRRRCQVFRTRCQVFARMRHLAPPPPGRSPRIGKDLHGFGKIATRFGAMAGVDVAICGISGIRRRKAGDGPPNTKGVGCRVLGCSVAVLQGAGLQCCRVLGCEVAGLQGRWVQSCWVAGLRVAGFGAVGYSAAA